MTKWIFAAFVLLPSFASAFEQGVSSSGFSDAAKNANYLRFDLNTKKLGFIKSHVTGYAKAFKAKGEINGHKLTNAVVEFAVRDLDTDLYARNDQMWNYCLGYKENPQVQVKIASLEFTEGKPISANATITLRGKEKKLPLEVTMEKKDGRWVASGKGESTFEALGIPDPSIGVASVDGPISIEFHVEDTK